LIELTDPTDPTELTELTEITETTEPTDTIRLSAVPRHLSQSYASGFKLVAEAAEILKNEN
jgi:hypothetical protein